MKDIYKTKRTNKDIFIVSMLMTVLIIILLAITTLAFFSENKDIRGQITLGELDFCVYNTGGALNVVPGNDINKQISLVNARNTSGTDRGGLCSILVKFQIDNNNLFSPIFNNDQNWTKLGNVYYYNNVLNPGQVVNLCDRVKFSENAGNEYQNQSIDILLQVNAIQAANEAYKELWKDAPNSWLEIIENIV